MNFHSFKLISIQFLFIIVPFILAQENKNAKVLIVMVSGTRWDYIHDPNLKGIKQIADNGVRAQFVYPVFPSDSFPNWYSLTTGLYAEKHGFVSDVMYDNETNEFFLPDIDNSNIIKSMWWNDAEPVWITAEKHGYRSALYWWPGCEVEIRDHHSTVCEIYRRGMEATHLKINFLERVNDVIEMFKNNELTLAMLHYDLVLEKGEEFGPESLERQKIFHEFDEILHTLQERLDKEHLNDKVNIIIISDHGMTTIKENRTKFLDISAFSKFIKYQVSYGAFSMLVPTDGKLDELVSELTNMKIKGIHVYKKEDIPPEYFIKNGKRTLPILLQADVGFYIQPLNDKQKVKGRALKNYRGAYGYDPYVVKDMRTIFLAKGPAFRKNVVSGPLYNTDIYNIVCKIIGLTPLANNGSWDRTQSLLVETYHGNENGCRSLSSVTELLFIFLFVNFFLLFQLRI